MSYFANIQQTITPDTNNSSTTNLASGASFVGTATNTLSSTGIQYSLKTDQNCTIYIDQADDIAAGVGTVTTNGTINVAGAGTKFLRDLRVGDQIWITGETVRVVASIISDISLTVTVACATTAGGLAFTQYYWDITDPFEYLASINNNGDTVYPIKSHVRARVTNNGASTTAYFRMAVVLVPIANPLPRSLSEHGYLKTAVGAIEDGYGWSVENTPMGEMRVAAPYRLVGTQPDGSTIDTNFSIDLKGIPFGNGLFFVLSGANENITVIYE